MCKPGQPCNEAKAGKANATQDLFARVEMLIVMADLHEAHKVEAPRAAIAMVDVIGPLLMDSMRKAKGWDGLQMAQAIIKQRAKLFADQGMTAPTSPLEALIGMLGEIEDKKREAAGENGAKPDMPMEMLIVALGELAGGAPTR
jgi:hypothetical protein